MKKINKKLIITVIVIAIIAIAVLMYFVFGQNKPMPFFSVEAKNSGITEEVNLTGQVKASQGVNLAFVVSGRIVSNYVKVGDKIYAGQSLAVLDQSSARATLTSAQGSLAQAQANRDKLINGATQNDMQSLQDAIASAKVNLNNVYNNASTTLNNSYTAIYNAHTTVNILYNNYFTSSDPQGIQVQNSKGNIDDNLAKTKSSIDQANSTDSTDLTIVNLSNYLNSTFNSLQIVRDQCDEGVYYYKITATDKASIDAQKTAISAAMSNISTLQNNIAFYKTALQTVENSLSIKQAKPRQEDVDLVNAQVLSAQGQVDSAQAVLNNTVLSAPFSGQVDKDNVVVGSIASPNSPVITISNNNLEIDTNIPEVNIPETKIGADASITLDAFGNDVTFPAIVVSIDSAPTVVNGISVYGARLKFKDFNERIKPGMTANINVISETHTNVLVIPATAVIKRDNKYFVVVDSNPTKESREVTVGLRDNKNIEIISGLKLGEKVFAY
jgi:HlyD family secretion protein